MKNNELIITYGTDAFQMGYQVMEASNICSMLPKSASIGIKPNLVVAKPSTSGATTTPLLVEGVITYLKEHEYNKITIMEGSWIGDSTKRAFEVCGYNKISQKYNIPLIDLKRDPTVSYSENGITMKVCKSAIETDFLINMPVLKAHCQTYITCALKNLKGCIPDSEKRNFHSLGLHTPIALLNKFLKCGMTIVDGLMGDLTFEEGGTPVRMDRVIAGIDPVLIDTFAANLLGYTPYDIRYIVEAEKLGVGSTDIDNAVIRELNTDKKPIGRIAPNHRVSRLTRNVIEDQACSACLGSLVHALNRLDEAGDLNLVNEKISIGQGFRGCEGEGLGIGNCAKGFSHYIPGCPPKAVDIAKGLREYFE